MNITNINDENLIQYKQKLDFFLEKVEELKSNLIDREIILNKENINSQYINNVLDAKAIDAMVKILNFDYSPMYFSINYFYNGLLNLGPLDNKNDIYFLMWVIACLLEEQFFISETGKEEIFLSNILEDKYTIYIRNNKENNKIDIQLDSFFKNFIVIKLPFLLQQENNSKIKKELHDPNAKFNKLSMELKKQDNEIRSKLDGYTKKTEEIAKFIKELRSKLNFAGLGSAFNQLKEDKNSSKFLIQCGMLVVFIILAAIPFCSTIFIWLWQPSLYIAVPLATLEIIFLYIFRLLYQQYLFVKSELLQIDLRYNLCAFIEGYMEFKKEHKDNTVELFEKLIFSNIVSDEKKVPATIDGLESITNLIHAIKRSS